MVEVELRDCVLYDAFLMVSAQDNSKKYVIDEHAQNILIVEYKSSAETTLSLLRKLCTAFNFKLVRSDLGYYSILRRK